jgi:hypothetical protein
MDLRPFIVASSQFLIFYANAKNDILTTNDHEFIIPLVIYCTAYTLSHSMINSEVDLQLVYDLLLYFILPPTVMLIYNIFNMDVSPGDINVDAGAILTYWVKLIFFW